MSVSSTLSHPVCTHTHKNNKQFLKHDAIFNMQLFISKNMTKPKIVDIYKKSVLVLNKAVMLYPSLKSPALSF